MTLLLSNEDAHHLLTMPDCMAALVESYAATHDGSAINGRRSDMVGPGGDTDSAYVLKMMGAILPQQKVGAIRINSDLFRWVSRGERRQRVKVPAAPGERWVGLVLLFSTETGEPLAIFPDGVVQRARVGATSGIALDRLARKDAAVLAILGSGWQAEAQVLAAATARRLTEIRCYSPNPERRSDFAAHMAAQTGVPTRACGAAEEAVKGADIVLCATNSLGHVFQESWCEAGMHLGAIRDRELDPGAIARADCVIVHDRGNLTGQHVELAKGAVFKEKAKELGQDPRTAKLVNAPSLDELIGGAAPGRGNDADVTCFLNYHGVGLQFAAIGALLYRRALAVSAGQHLPTEWFTEDVHS
ncbi:MAG TPA: NAD(P)-binding domain-containing protein [Dongiaceae bacterium]|jgi:ornithine cyclodeaminase/alanine dehydrogenase-like protein (mu-crystallin family)|nr:NAD(P)-binding domain-containing protein [Dongiaceae bacterium]